jgi:hypothetical protein
MVRVASSLNTGVSAADASGYWKSVGTRCAGGLSRPQKAWVALFAATGARHAADTAARADEVLALDDYLTYENRAYAALASVAGHTFSMRRPKASEVLKEQSARLQPEQLEASWFRYLAYALLTREKPQP